MRLNENTKHPPIAISAGQASGGPTLPVQLFFEQRPCKRRDKNWRRHIKRHHIRQREQGRRPIKGRNFAREKDGAHNMKPRSRRAGDIADPVLHDGWYQQEKPCCAAEQQDLPHRVGCHQPFAEDIVRDIEKHAEQHEQNAHRQWRSREEAKRGRDRSCSIKFCIS